METAGDRLVQRLEPLQVIRFERKDIRCPAAGVVAYVVAEPVDADLLGAAEGDDAENV